MAIKKLGVIAATLLILCLAQMAVAQDEDNPRTYMLEVGTSYYVYTPNTPTAQSMYAAFMLSRPYIDSWRFDVGFEDRYNEEAVSYGVVYTRFFKHSWRAWLGYGSGNSDVLSPDYRASIGVGKGIFSGFNLDVGYTRIQSRVANYADMYSIGYTWYLGNHIITGGGYHYDVGHPGNTVSQSVDLGISVGVWRQFYIGGGVRFGDVSYQLVPNSGQNLQVDYSEDSFFLSLSLYLKQDLGINLRVDSSENDFNNIHGFTMSVFKEW
ncbi:MAG: YaiO family outer membrane beta-barrel protein [bacterium]|nr:YaiO family outer membrane beta-barrel protein [bacterium]